MISEVKWVSITDGLPEYSHKVGGSGFVHIWVLHNEFPNALECMYSDGKWYEALILSSVMYESMKNSPYVDSFAEGITHWAYTVANPNYKGE